KCLLAWMGRSVDIEGRGLGELCTYDKMFSKKLKMESVGMGVLTLRSCLKASKIQNIDGIVMGKDGKPLKPLKPIRKVQISEKEADNVNTQNPSSANEMYNTLYGYFIGHRLAFPLEAVEAVSSRFVNTLYGYFIGHRLAFPLVENYDGMESVLENGLWLIRRIPLMLNVWSQTTDLKKTEVKKALVWVKLHHVPIVAYSEVGLSLITTQIGTPIMLDSYTSNMCVSSWGRSTYARALIEVSADVELMDELVIAIPAGKDKGHSLATIKIEYEWRPPRCSTCLIFDHD
ncbi:zinc knuckle CX2CX4HX4C containing protein, partial [Tanacetum coccineum]